LFSLLVVANLLELFIVAITIDAPPPKKPKLNTCQLMIRIDGDVDFQPKQNIFVTHFCFQSFRCEWKFHCGFWLLSTNLPKQPSCGDLKKSFYFL